MEQIYGTKSLLILNVNYNIKDVILVTIVM